MKGQTPLRGRGGLGPWVYCFLCCTVLLPVALTNALPPNAGRAPGWKSSSSSSLSSLPLFAFHGTTSRKDPLAFLLGRRHPLSPHRSRIRVSIMGYRRSDGQEEEEEAAEEDTLEVHEEPSMEEEQQQAEQPESDFEYQSAHSTLWLEDVTESMLDLEEYPLGTLTASDMDIMEDLLSTWPRRRTVQAALKVEQLLKRIVDEMHVNETIQIETKLYTYAMEAWAKSGAKGAPERAQSIHDALVQRWKEGGSERLAPNTESYNSLLVAWSRSPPVHVENVLKEMLELYQSNKLECVQPDATTVTIVLETYLRDLWPGMDHPHNQRSVQRCEELVTFFRQTLALPDSIAVWSVLQSVYARSGLPRSVEQTERVVERLQNLYQTGNHLAKPNVLHYNAVLTALSRRPSQSNAKKACDVLRRMELSVQDGGLDVSPDRLSYATTILACARCPELDFAALASESVLEKMEQRSKLEEEERKKVSSAALPSVRLDLESFNVVLMALSRSRLPDAPLRAEKIIERLKSYADVSGESLQPSIRTWNGHLYVKKAENLLREILDRNRNGTSSAKPNAFTFTGLLSVYQRSSEPAAAKRVEEIVHEMEDLYQRGEILDPPDTYHYTILCGTYARSYRKDASIRVLQILSHMIKLSNSGHAHVAPNTRTFNSVLDCLTKAGETERAEEILRYMVDLSRSGKPEAAPDSFSFRSVIIAFTKSKERGSTKRAEQILDLLLQYYEEENASVRPDSKSFKIIIESYCDRGDPDSPYRAEYLLNRMIARFRDGERFLEPPLYCFTSVIKSYAYAAHPDAGRNAERLVKTVRSLIGEGAQYLIVNTALLNSAILAYSSCKDENAGQRAENYLDEMEAAFKKGDTNLQPTSRSYNLVLSSWSKSTCSYKFRRALSVLRRMERQANNGNKLVEVDAYSFAVVINACGFCNDSIEVELEAFNVAVKLFDVMITEHEPNSLCYGWFIECVGRLRVAQEVKNLQIKRAFEHCCEAGMVNGFVLQKLKSAATLEQSRMLLKHKLTGDKTSSVTKLTSLPKVWSRNASKKETHQ